MIEGEKYYCPYCSKEISSLIDEIETRRNSRPPPRLIASDPDFFPYYCVFCGGKFFLRRHMGWIVIDKLDREETIGKIRELHDKIKKEIDSYNHYHYIANQGFFSDGGIDLLYKVTKRGNERMMKPIKEYLEVLIPEIRVLIEELKTSYRSAHDAEPSQDMEKIIKRYEHGATFTVDKIRI